MVVEIILGISLTSTAILSVVVLSMRSKLKEAKALTNLNAKYSTTIKNFIKFSAGCPRCSKILQAKLLKKKYG